MEKINMNKKVRERINSINEKYKIENGGNSLFETGIIGITRFSPYEEEQKLADIINILTKTTGYSDMYTSLVLKQRLMGLTDAEHEYLKMLKEIDSYDKLQIMYRENPKMCSIAAKEMIGFYNSSVYHKILRMKCLSDEDIKQISKINTIFNQDLDSYNVDIDLDYIINRILKFKARGNDLEDLLNDATAFITNMRRISNKYGKMLILKLIESTINTFCLVREGEPDKYLRSIFNSYKYDIELLLNEIGFDELKELLKISATCTLNKEEFMIVPLNDENKKLLNAVKKYELEIDKNV